MAETSRWAAKVLRGRYCPEAVIDIEDTNTTSGYWGDLK